MSFREIEVEVATDADSPDALAAIVDALVAAGAVAGPAVPKAFRALGSAARAPADVESLEVGSDPSARDVIRSALARSVVELVLALPVARIGDDPEGVHRARVATRRLRSDLRTFRTLLDSVWVRELQGELAWLGGGLGPIRDADVLTERLQACLDDHPEINSESGRRVLAILAEQRQRHRSALLEDLASARLNDLLERLVVAANDPRTAAQADEPAAERLPILVRRRWRRLRSTVESLGADPPAARLHDVRILAKRARYAAEALAPAFGDEASAFARAVTGVQDALGDLNDASVAEAWLAEAAVELDPEAAFAAGRLAQAISGDARQRHQEWRPSYEQAARKKLRSWFR